MINKKDVRLTLVGNGTLAIRDGFIENFTVKAMKGFHIHTETEIFIYRNGKTIAQMGEIIYERLEALLHKK